MAHRNVEVRLTAGAERDLSGLYRRRLALRGAGGADGADVLLQNIIAAIEQLAEWPERGAVPPELDAIGIRAYRQLSLTPFRVIYAVEEKPDHTVATVMIIADTRRDFRTLLEERLISPR